MNTSINETRQKLSLKCAKIIVLNVVFLDVSMSADANFMMSNLWAKIQTTECELRRVK